MNYEEPLSPRPKTVRVDIYTEADRERERERYQKVLDEWNARTREIEQNAKPLNSKVLAVLAVIALLSIIILALTACGGSPTGPTRSAHIEPYGELTMTCSGDTCTFTGLARNVGTETAVNVTGHTSFRVHGKLVAVPVAVEDRIAPGASVPFSGTTSVLLERTGTSDTTFDWRR